jgi:spore coat protein U-like protein
VELTIGSDDGRRRVDGTLRYMADGTAQLAYAITSESGGDILERDFELDENGHATTQFTLDAEITSSGSEAIVGSYMSDDLVALKFCETGLTGEAACTESAMTSSFTVLASVTASCTVSVSNMDFGNIAPDVVAAVDQIATISLSCTNASAYTIGLSHGAHSVDSGPTGRRMNNNGDLLAYGLYRDAARTENWGHDAGSVAVGVGTGGGQSLSVFGRLLSNQEAFAGTYSDTVVVIVTY